MTSPGEPLSRANREGRVGPLSLRDYALSFSISYFARLSLHLLRVLISRKPQRPQKKVTAHLSIRCSVLAARIPAPESAQFRRLGSRQLRKRSGQPHRARELQVPQPEAETRHPASPYTVVSWDCFHQTSV